MASSFIASSGDYPGAHVNATHTGSFAAPLRFVAAASRQPLPSVVRRRQISVKSVVYIFSKNQTEPICLEKMLNA